MATASTSLRLYDRISQEIALYGNGRSRHPEFRIIPALAAKAKNNTTDAISALETARCHWRTLNFKEARRWYKSPNCYHLAEAQLEFALMACFMEEANDAGTDKDALVQEIVSALAESATTTSPSPDAIIIFEQIYRNSQENDTSDEILLKISDCFCDNFGRNSIDDVVEYYWLKTGKEHRRLILANFVDEMCTNGLLPEALKSTAAEAVSDAIESVLEIAEDSAQPGKAVSWAHRIDAARVSGSPIAPESFLEVGPAEFSPWPTWPENWDEAKAEVPKLRRWAEVKREAGLSAHKQGFDQAVYDLMVEHLRNPETGLARWAESPHGLPRHVLRKIDDVLRQEIHALGNPHFPEDLNMPRGSRGRPPHISRFDAPPTPEQIQVAMDTINRAKWYEPGYGRFAASPMEDGVAGEGLLEPSTPYALPAVAPAKWNEGKFPGETPPEFIMRVYGAWMKGAERLTLADVRRLDAPLAQSLYYHTRKGRSVPKGFDLPTLAEKNTRDLSRLSEFGPSALPGVGGENALREFSRLRQAALRRQRSDKQER